ncbi:hypothetical protein FEM48_Zijuj05G0028100 [Ziziphus jujuba var. spinosa]|uniref:Uncharacterized protein n=1 Tax=Ziziphus jujuba var. spinosa TaxID=714518 RepID=A0A978VCD7_ZIZJJ|nr:hypothetical protein FEM48_Zijuj05G0028100 [Ziziphus jujuba var. spinosa]
MASYPSFISYLLFGCLLYLSCLNKSFGRELNLGFEGEVIDIVPISSLETICSPSTKDINILTNNKFECHAVNNNRKSLKEVDKHGPCSQLYQDLIEELVLIKSLTTDLRNIVQEPDTTTLQLSTEPPLAPPTT